MFSVRTVYCGLAVVALVVDSVAADVVSVGVISVVDDGTGGMVTGRHGYVWP